MEIVLALFQALGNITHLSNLAAMADGFSSCLKLKTRNIGWKGGSRAKQVVHEAMK